jgi:hypothetical protein
MHVLVIIKLPKIYSVFALDKLIASYSVRVSNICKRSAKRHSYVIQQQLLLEDL